MKRIEGREDDDGDNMTLFRLILNLTRLNCSFDLTVDNF